MTRRYMALIVFFEVGDGRMDHGVTWHQAEKEAAQLMSSIIWIIES